MTKIHPVLKTLTGCQRIGTIVYYRADHLYIEKVSDESLRVYDDNLRPKCPECFGYLNFIWDSPNDTWVIRCVDCYRYRPLQLIKPRKVVLSTMKLGIVFADQDIQKMFDELVLIQNEKTLPLQSQTLARDLLRQFVVKFDCSIAN